MEIIQVLVPLVPVDHGASSPWLMQSGEVAGGAWGIHGYQTQSCLLGHEEILGNLLLLCQGTCQAAAVNTGTLSRAQSRKQLLEQMKGGQGKGQGKGFNLLYLKSHLVSWQGKPQRIFFGDPATLKDLNLTWLPLLSGLKHRREKGWYL